jgi:hypothetical protein
MQGRPTEFDRQAHAADGPSDLRGAERFPSARVAKSRDGSDVDPGAASASTLQILRLQRSAGNAAVASLLLRTARSSAGPAIQRQSAERSQELHMTRPFSSAAEPEGDSWDGRTHATFGVTSYATYQRTVLQSATFFGQTVEHLHPELTAVLHTVERNLLASQGSGYRPPRIDSGFRYHKGMHGWGMAVDFDVVENPYVLNESGEAALDRELRPAYDHVAQFMLGDAASALRRIRGGRSAFGGGSIGEVYDALRRESDAMRRYFTLKDDANALTAFLANEWPALHPGQPAPDPDAVRAQMTRDYEILGGPTNRGTKLPTSGGDRPFAPSSGGGRGDPRTGFLNLPREFVQAMTDAGLAWGAVDIGGEPGDVQHFDLRLMGSGSKAYQALLRRP